MKRSLFIILLLTYQVLSACTCMGKENLKKSIKHANLIFLGKVISMDTVNIPVFIHNYSTISNKGGLIFNSSTEKWVQITFELKKLYKGKAKSNIVFIFTKPGKGNCGYPFLLNRMYVVYAKRKKRLFKKGPKVNSFYVTDICTRTTDKIQEEIQKIGKYYHPKKKMFINETFYFINQ